jgi:hypothetical protein
MQQMVPMDWAVLFALCSERQSRSKRLGAGDHEMILVVAGLILSKECDMKKLKTIGFVLLAFPMGVGVAAATSNGGQPGDGHPGCKPSDNTPQKCRTTSTVTVTTPGTTVTQVETVTAPGTTVTVPAPPSPPTIVVTPGPVNNTVTITITINGTSTSTTVPGTMPGSEPACVNTRKSAVLGPLPIRYAKVKEVAVRINGGVQNHSTLPGRHVNVNLPTKCGVYAIVINDVPNKRSIRPVLRIWSLTGGNGLQRVGFPLPVPPIGLS